ncbi:MAG: hypothetical protein R3E53_11330 [Myxococcota bacterium]
MPSTMPSLTPDMQRVLGLALLILNVALYAGAFRHAAGGGTATTLGRPDRAELMGRASARAASSMRCVLA